MAIAKVPAASLYDTPLEGLDQITRTVNRLVDEVNDLTTEQVLERARPNPPIDLSVIHALRMRVQVLEGKLERAESSRRYVIEERDDLKVENDVLKVDLEAARFHLKEEKSWALFPTTGKTPEGFETRFQYRLKS